MDTTRFDQITSSVVQAPTRREALRLLGVAVLGASGLSLLKPDDGEAKRRRKNKKRKGKKHGSGSGNGTGGGNGDGTGGGDGSGTDDGQTQVLPPGALCQNDAQCATPTNHQICEVPKNASNSDTKCCGATGAICGGVNEDGDAQPPFCCIGEAGVRAFRCSESDLTNPNVQGTCIPLPPE